MADPLAWFPEGFSPFKTTCPCRCTIQVERRTELRDLAQSGPLTGHAGTGPAGQMRVMWVKCGPCGPDAGVTGVRRGCQLECSDSASSVLIVADSPLPRIWRAVLLN